MARGKQAKAAASRRATQLAAAFETTRAELAAEQELLTVIEAEERGVAELQERLAAARAAREAGTVDEIARLRPEVELLRTATVDAEPAVARVRDHWEPASDSVIGLLGDGVRGLELFMSIVAVKGGHLVDDRLRKLDSVRAQQIEVARRQRRHVTTRKRDKDRPPRPLHGLLHPDLDTAFDAEADDGTPPPPAVVAAAEAVQNAAWATATPDALYTWHPFPWTRDPYDAGQDHPVAATLGFTAQAAAWERPAPFTDAAMTIEATPTAALSAARRQHLAQQSPRRVIDAWQRHLTPSTTVQERWPTALSTPPLHPTSADAAAVKHWYTLTALGQWLKANTHSPEHGYAAGTIGVAMAAAPVYWLPPTQTFDMLDSEPVTDLDDLRLPYPQVMLIFAEPPVIPPWDGVLDEDRQAEATRAGALIEGALLTELRNTIHAPMQCFSAFVASDPEDHPFVPVWDMLAVRGARVEGILLLGDSLGRLAPHAAWALAIPSINGHHAAQRVLVPTRWENSAWRDQILNAAAVVAWADWHAPLDPADGDPDTPGINSSPRRNQDGSDVRVLAVRRTRTGTSDRSEPTGRTVAAHVRRGHWRRQHHGPRGELVKRIRIAPTVVNAGQRSFAARVYVLPAAN